MAASPLTMDAALALLDGYDEEGHSLAGTAHELPLALALPQPLVEDSVAGIWPTSPTATALPRQDEAEEEEDKGTRPSDRFRRARERKKRELSTLRAQASDLEDTLHRLKQQRLSWHAGTRQLVWREAAARQLKERREAEQLNAQLRAMTTATLKQTRRLRALLLYPDGLEPLVHHKRLRPHAEPARVASAVEWHGLLIALDLLELEVDDTLATYQSVGDRLVLKPGRSRRDGCHLSIEAFDASVIGYDLATTSEGVWQKLASEFAPVEALSTDASATVSRVATMEVANGSFRANYTGSFVYRRRVMSDARVVVLWTSEWEPVGLTDWSDVCHESFRRQGFVCLSPSPIDATRFTNVHTLHRVEREGCGDPKCERGACGDETVAKAETSIFECVEGEIKRVIQGIENDLMMAHGRAKAAAAAVFSEQAVLESLAV